MKMKHTYRWVRFLCVMLAAVLALVPVKPVRAVEMTEMENFVFINEIESDDADGGNDWVEIINAGQTDVDISGWFLTDDAGLERLTEGTAWPIAEGTILTAGSVLVLEDSIDFDFGLGKSDAVTLYNADCEMMDTYSWSGHAAGTYSRIPGTSNFVDQAPTKGMQNIVEPDEGGTGEGGIDEGSIGVGPVVINEVESNGDTTDWVEIYNAGPDSVDISGWYLLDNDPVGHAEDVMPVADGTILESGEYYVFDQGIDFAFGLGSNDQVTVFDKDGNPIAEFAWTQHAAVVYARIPDGTGEFVDFQVSTKGMANAVRNPVVLNEVQSNDPDGGPDWIELANPTDVELDVSGILVKDDDDTHEYIIPEGTVIPAGGYVVLTEDEFGFGLGKNDSVRLFEGDLLIASTTWPEHTDPTWGLYPDVNGTEYRSTSKATPGEANQFEDASEEEPHIHDYVAVVTEPTCGAEGYTTYTCAICGDSYIADYTAPTGNHVYQDETDTTCDVCGYVRTIEVDEVESVPMFRLYNPYSGEHFYTGSTEERDGLVELGWNYEGVAWNSPIVGEPVYRVYNPNSGDHHYTMDQKEVDMLVDLGWRYEGVAWNTASEEDVPQYRLWNPNADLGSHHYTSSEEERDYLVSLGWVLEGIGWYGMLK